MAPLSGARTLRPFLGAFLIEERIIPKSFKASHDSSCDFIFSCIFKIAAR